MNGSTISGAGEAKNRRALDFYPTPDNCTIALLEFLKLDRSIKVWEPAAGNGAMVRVLEKYFDSVIGSDIITGFDYLQTYTSAYDTLPVGAIITNPPFNLAAQFITKALLETEIVAMLLKSQYWHSSKRRQVFIKNPPAYVLPLTWRPDFLEHERTDGKRGSPTMDVAWTVWIKGNHSAKYFPLAKPSL